MILGLLDRGLYTIVPKKNRVEDSHFLRASALGAARSAAGPGHDRSREHPGGASVDQEPGAGARPGEEADEKRDNSGISG